jgi:hypothetical protein
MSGYGYGANPRCSPLQQQWQTCHPHFLAVQPRCNVKAYTAQLKQQLHLSGVDPSVLQPPSLLSLLAKGRPELMDYVQLPMHLWVPDYFYPDLVPFMPCPIERCKEITVRRRWHSGGPLVIHGLHHAVYLHCWEYECSSADHKGKTFAGWDDGSIDVPLRAHCRGRRDDRATQAHC